MHRPSRPGEAWGTCGADGIVELGCSNRPRAAVQDWRYRAHSIAQSEMMSMEMFWFKSQQPNGLSLWG